jgi:hypothetical protein
MASNKSVAKTGATGVGDWADTGSAHCAAVVPRNGSLPEEAGLKPAPAGPLPDHNPASGQHNVLDEDGTSGRCRPEGKLRPQTHNR